jgi:hypothetical protein
MFRPEAKTGKSAPHAAVAARQFDYREKDRLSRCFYLQLYYNVPISRVLKFYWATIARHGSIK